MKCPYCQAGSNDYGVYLGKKGTKCLKCGMLYDIGGDLSEGSKDREQSSGGREPMLPNRRNRNKP